MDRLSCSNTAFHVVIPYGTGSIYVHFCLGSLRVYVFFSKVLQKYFLFFISLKVSQALK
jgi:hypothetical protein